MCSTVAGWSYKLCCDVWLNGHILLLLFIFPIPQPKKTKNTDLVIWFYFKHHMTAILKTVAELMFFSSIFLCRVYIFQWSLSEVSPPVFSQGAASWTLVQTASMWECVTECVSFEWWTVATPMTLNRNKQWMKWNEWIDVGLQVMRGLSSLSFFLCIQNETQSADRFATHLRQPT